MLQKEAVVPEIINLIKELQSNSLFQEHILAGGTALSLHLGHRTSTDIDLFTSKPQNTFAIIKYFMNTFININVEIANDSFIRIYVNDIKVEMVFDDEKIIETPINDENIRLFGINEISAMKLRAITGRSKGRDFIDIAYLLREIPLNKMFSLYKEKYGTISPLYMKRTLLVKSQSIKDNEWLIGIKMIRHDIEPKDVPLFIEHAVEEYNKNIGIK